MNKVTNLCLSALAATTFSGCNWTQDLNINLTTDDWKKEEQVDWNKTNETPTIGITSFCNYPIRIDGVNYMISGQIWGECERNQDITANILNAYDNNGNNLYDAITWELADYSNVSYKIIKDNTTNSENNETVEEQEEKLDHITSVELKEHILKDLDLEWCLSFDNKPSGNIKIINWIDGNVIFDNWEYLITKEELSQITISDMDFVFWKWEMKFQVWPVEHRVYNY